MNAALSSLNQSLSDLGRGIDQLSAKFEAVRDFYELLDIRNKVETGTVSFPVNTVDLSRGISVEFKNVSFSYSSDSGGELVLKNVSFEIGSGHLCVCPFFLLIPRPLAHRIFRKVIVGENGSGKSTILNLITRIYDVTEGQILLNGVDIRTLRLDDVRKAVAVLFQEYAIFPLTVSPQYPSALSILTNPYSSLEKTLGLEIPNTPMMRIWFKKRRILEEPIL